jgi:hypothetical protein
VNKELIHKMQSQFDAFVRYKPCTTTDYGPKDHFRNVTKMVSIGSRARAKA